MRRDVVVHPGRGLRWAVVLGAVLALVFPLVARAVPSSSNTLVAPATLISGQQLSSTSGSYLAIMQADGNFVVYGPSGPTWASGTSGSGASVTMQADGNLVVYAGGRALFSTGTFGSSASAVMQDDGNFVVYGAGRALWSSKSGPIPPPVTSVGSVLNTGGTLTVNQQLVSPDQAYVARMQLDGNFVVYGPLGATWSSRTSGSGASVTMQTDGNLVVYAGGRALFATGTSSSAASAVMQDDGNFVVYGSSRALWSSKTGLIPVPVTSVGSVLNTGMTLKVNEELMSPSNAYSALLHPDGAFIVSGPSGAIWSTKTKGLGATLIMQSDGNLVLYAGGAALFATSTSGSSPSAVMQDDGNFVVYGSGRALWSSKSGRI